MPFSLGSLRQRFNNAVDAVGRNSLVRRVGDAATYVADKVDQYDVVSGAVSQVARNRRVAQVVGAVTGVVRERMRPGSFRNHGRAVGAVARRMGLDRVLPRAAPGAQRVMKGAQSVVGAGIGGAGLAAIAYDAITSVTDTKADTGSRLAQGAAAVGVGAATFIPGVGTAIVAADVVTGGGVTGGVKGLVAVADAALTGDRDAMNAWVESAKAGDMGWALEKAANNKTVARAAGQATEAVIGGAAALGDSMASGWRALRSW